MEEDFQEIINKLVQYNFEQEANHNLLWSEYDDAIKHVKELEKENKELRFQIKREDVQNYTSELLEKKEKELLKLICESNIFKVTSVMRVHTNKCLRLMNNRTLEYEYTNTLNDNWFNKLQYDKEYTLEELGLSIMEY